MDLDKISDENGNVHAYVLNLIEQAGTFAEYSPSGNGVLDDAPGFPAKRKLGPKGLSGGAALPLPE